MARMQFTSGTRFWLHQQVYVVQHPLAQGKLLVDNLSMGAQERPTYDELYAAWSQGELRFQIPSILAAKSSTVDSPPDYTIEDFHGITNVDHRTEAWRRYELIKPLLNLPPWKRTRAAIQAYADSLLDTYPKDPDHRRPPMGHAASRASIERWLHDYVESGYDIRVLVPGINHRADKGQSRLNPEVDRLMQATFEECKAKPARRSRRRVQLMVVNRIADVNRFRPPDQKLKPPALRTVYDRIQDAGPESILQRRPSRLEAHAQQPYSRGPQPTRIMERVEIDISPIHAFVVDDVDRFPIGRPTLTTERDKYSMLPVGVELGFEPGSYRSVMNCLRHGTLPKVDTRELYGTKHLWPAFGLPETLVVDNGRAFIGDDLTDACGVLGINLEPTQIRKPWLKGGIERSFKTNNTELIHSLPGTSFSNVVDRGDYDAIENACITLNDFLKILHIYLLDIYAQDRHTKLGIVPAHRWEEGIQAGFMPSLLQDVNELSMILYPSEWRTIHRGTIEFECLRYHSLELGQLHRRHIKGEQAADGTNQTTDNDSNQVAEEWDLPSNGMPVRIKYNPGDLHEIYVIDPESQKPLAVKADDPAGYTIGLSIWKHRRIRRYAQHQYAEPDIWELAEAYGRIQEIVDAAWEITRKTRRSTHATNSSKTSTRTTAARFNEYGTSGLPTPTTLSLANSQPSHSVDPQTEVPHADSGQTTSEAQAPAESPASGEREPSLSHDDHSGDTTASSAQETPPRPARSRKNKSSSDAAPPNVPSERPPLDLTGWSAGYDLPGRK